MALPRESLPRVDSLEDVRRTLVELVDKINQIIEEVNRLADLVEPVD